MQLRVPSDESLPGIASYASLIWRLTTYHLKETPMRPGTALHIAIVLKLGGIAVAAALTVMEFRASSYWHRMRDRANSLCETLNYQPFPVSSRWSPLTTSGAGFYLHLIVVLMWISSLFIRFSPEP